MVHPIHEDHPNIALRMRFRGHRHLLVLVALAPRFAMASKTIEKASCRAHDVIEEARNLTRRKVLMQVHSEVQSMSEWMHERRPAVVTAGVPHGLQKQHHNSSLLQRLFTRALTRGKISSRKEASQDAPLILILTLCLGILMFIACLAILLRSIGSKGADESDPMSPASRTSPSRIPLSGELWDNHRPDDSRSPLVSSQVLSQRQSPPAFEGTDRQPASRGSPMSSKNITPQSTTLRSPEAPANAPLVSPESPEHVVRQLCPGLVVPKNNECLLAVPTLASVGVPPLDFAAFDVRDIGGKAVIQAEVVAPNWLSASPAPTSGANAGQRPMAVLRAAGSGSARPLLCYCKAAQQAENRKSVYIYDSRDELFAHISKDPFRDCYILTNGKGLNLIFEGNFREHCVQVKNGRGEQMADTEPASMEFDPVGSFYRMRVVSGADVGLMLCGMLAIEHMEAGA